MESAIFQGKCVRVQQPSVGSRQATYPQVLYAQPNSARNNRHPRRTTTESTIDYNQLSSELLALSMFCPN